MITQGRFAFLPGGEIFETGLRDLGAETLTLYSALVGMAWPRLEPLGLLTRTMVDRVRHPGEDLELTAYRLLIPEFGKGAHARFMALSAELESGINALEREHRLAKKGALKG